MGPDIHAIRAAHVRLQDHVHRTPLLESVRLNKNAGSRILIKAECLQKTGSFKFRGATNALLALGNAERQAGVVAYSSGNHALAVSAAAKTLGVRAVVVMPSDAPSPKIEGARAAGAEVILYDRHRDDRVAMCEKLSREQGLTLIPPFDHASVIAGQGTLAVEAYEQAADLGVQVDSFLAPCSGGGLISGCAIVSRAMAPHARIFAVEPQGFDDMARSLQSGVEQRNASVSGSICDSLLAISPGKLTLPIARQMGVEGLQVSDDQVMTAMRWILDEFNLVAEPGGAAALAAAMNSEQLKERTSLVVVSGGNVDPALAQRVANWEVGDA